MIRRRTLLVLSMTAGLSGATAPVLGQSAGPKVGAPAPAFTTLDSDGRAVSLADYKGRTVVLEWTNDGCPFVAKHYGGKAMQALQQKWTEKGIVWLSVISSAPGQQGYADGPRANALTAERGARPSAVLLDPTGTVGRAYAAKTTPEMFVITGDGILAFMGGIDDKPSTRQDDLKTARNFVDAALADLAAGRPVSTAAARPYGCSVKYSS